MYPYLATMEANGEVIAYRKEYNKITGSALSSILLQQVVFRFKSQGRKPFYKFKDVCEHTAYNEGDSWLEELGFTRSNFDTALSKIGQKLSKGVKKDPNKLVYYWVTIDRMTYYDLNIDLLESELKRIYMEIDSDFTKSKEVAARKVETPLYEKRESSVIYNTENTTKNTNKEEGLFLKTPNKQKNIGNQAPTDIETEPELKPLPTCDIKKMPLPYRFRKMLESFTGTEFINDEFQSVTNLSFKVKKYLQSKDKSGLNAKVQDDDVINLVYYALTANKTKEEFSTVIKLSTLPFKLLDIIRDYEKELKPTKPESMVYVRRHKKQSTNK